MSDYTEHLSRIAGGDGEPEPLDLDAIQARADAATEGPWEATHRPNLSPENDPDILAKERAALGGESGSAVRHGDKTAWGSVWPHRNGSADAEFIAAARTDVPALLALVREQQARIVESKAEATA